MMAAYKTVMLNKNQSLLNGHGFVVQLAPALRSAATISKCDKGLILDNEDRAPSKTRVFMRHLCAAKRKCQGRPLCDGPRGPEPSINPRRATSAMIDWQKAMSA